jgi:signal transduction histidine kinase
VYALKTFFNVKPLILFVTNCDPSQKSTGMGMINLKNRLEAIGGEFKLSSILEKGTVIKLILPIQIS